MPVICIDNHPLTHVLDCFGLDYPPRPFLLRSPRGHGVRVVHALTQLIAELTWSVSFLNVKMIELEVPLSISNPIAAPITTESDALALMG